MAQRIRQPKVATKEPAHDLDLTFEPERDFDCCECGLRLTDFGACPKCDLGEEGLDEGIFDKPTMNSWVYASGRPINMNNMSSPSRPVSQVTSNTTPVTNNKYRVRIVSHGGRLRALGTDGVHPAAWVAFPNDLRQFEGQQYEVDQLIWNGKNYRVAGNIVEI